MLSLRRWLRTLRPVPAGCRSVRLRVEMLEPRCVPAVFDVLNTLDTGAGSLRQAILDANATAGADIIRFNIVGANVHTISLASALPDITEAVLIDGFTQTGASANTLAVGDDSVHRIELDGGGTVAEGLRLTSADSTVRGLAIGGFTDYGIRITGVGATGNLIVGNFIGTDAAGNSTAANGVGVLIDGSASGNSIGGVAAADRNVISGNAIEGIRVAGASNTVAGNYVGLDAAGTSDLANGIDGVVVTGASNIVSSNVVAFHAGTGVLLTTTGATGNVVAGNIVGLDAAGDAAGNGDGIALLGGASGNSVGAGNVASGNLRFGVYVDNGGTANNTVSGNFIGTDAAGLAGPGNGQDGVYVGTTGNTIGGASAAAGNTISGNGGYGVWLFGSGTTAANNIIGLDANGDVLGNSNAGVYVVGANHVVRDNIIAGNGGAGVLLSGTGATGNVVAGNTIGLNAAGADRGNESFGVLIDSGATSNTVGGATLADRNVITANAAGTFTGTILANVAIRSDDNTVLGNFIGTDAAGTAVVATAGNLRGVIVDAASGNLVRGNVIGGQISAITFANNADANQVRGNFIGTDLTGTLDLGNDIGVTVLNGSDNNTIGGTTLGDGNVIAFNSVGVAVLAGMAGTDPAGARIVGNSIYANAGLGIDLGYDGRTANDAGDADTGPNGLLNAPVLTSQSGTAIAGYLDAPIGTYRVEFYGSETTGSAGQGRTFLGFTTVVIAAGRTAFSAFITDPGTGNAVTAVAISQDNDNTSEFSRGAPVSISPLTGSSSTTVATAFPNASAVEVLDAWGDAAEGVSVTFAVPPTGPSGSLLGPASVETDAAGQASAPSLEANTVAGDWSLTATVTGLTPVSFVMTNLAGVATTFTVTGFPATTAAGAVHTVTVTAYDVYGNVADDYNGTATLTSNDPQALSLGMVNLVNGVGSTSVALRTVGTRSIVADDGSVTGMQSGIVVTPGVAVTFVLTPLLSGSVAGASVDFAIEALDAFGNRDTAYNGTAALSSDDPLASLPASVALTAGASTFAVTFRTAGGRSVSAIASPVAGTSPALTVVAGPAVRLELTGLATNLTAGQSDVFTVTARDAFGNIADGYSAGLTFSTDGFGVELPASAVLSGGTGTFTATFRSGSEPPPDGDGRTRVTVSDGTFTATAETSIAATLVPQEVVFVALDGVFFVGRVATFTAVGFANSADFEAIIDWDDGTFGVGTVLPLGGGAFEVRGDHTFIGEDNFLVDVLIRDRRAGSEEVALSTAVVLTPGQGAVVGATGFDRSEPGDTVLTTSNGEDDVVLRLARDFGSEATVFVARYAGNPQGVTVADAAAFFDLRATGIDLSAIVTVRFRVPATSFEGVTVRFFDRRSGAFVPVQGAEQFVEWADAAQTQLLVTLTFDADSFPNVLQLDGTVFTVSVPTPSTPTPAPVPQPLAAATPSAATPLAVGPSAGSVAVPGVGFSLLPGSNPVATTAVPFAPAGQVTLTLSTGRDTTVTVRRSDLSAGASSGGGEVATPETTPEEAVPGWLRRLLNSEIVMELIFGDVPALADGPLDPDLPVVQPAADPEADPPADEAVSDEAESVSSVPMCDTPPVGAGVLAAGLLAMRPMRTGRRDQRRR